ncbi:serine/threonine protein kinase [Spirillospora sp. CA-253888]
MRAMAHLHPGDPAHIGSYTLTGRLGEGGQGVVYLARGADGTEVAVKLLRDAVTEEGAQEMFAKEVGAARSVAEFCTARVLDHGLYADRPYVVTEFIDGPTLQRLVERNGPLGGPELDRLAIGSATALSAIHRSDVVHRDLKPANVIMGPDGPRVIDFGIARVVEAAAMDASRIVGTPAYMAPEQMEGHGIGAAADMWAWAATMVFAATGRSPFGSESFPEMVRRVNADPPDLGALTGQLRDLAASCLVRDPARRPSAFSVLSRLLGYDTAPKGMQSEVIERGQLTADSLPIGPVASPQPPPQGGAPAAGPQQMWSTPQSSPQPASEEVGVAPAQPWTPQPWPPEQGGGSAPPRGGGRRRTALLVTAVAVAALLLVGAGVAAGMMLFRDDDGEPARRAAGPSGGTSAAPTPTPAASDMVTAAFAGKWFGSGTYRDGDNKKQPFKVLVELTDQSRTGTTKYSGYECDGALKVETVTNDTLMAYEVIVRGQNDACKDAATGYVTLKMRADGKMDYFWYPNKRGQQLEDLGSTQQQGVLARRN